MGNQTRSKHSFLATFLPIHYFFNSNSLRVTVNSCRSTSLEKRGSDNRPIWKIFVERFENSAIESNSFAALARRERKIERDNNNCAKSGELERVENTVPVTCSVYGKHTFHVLIITLSLFSPRSRVFVKLGSKSGSPAGRLIGEEAYRTNDLETASSSR